MYEKLNENAENAFGMTLVGIFTLGNHPIPADFTCEILIEKLGSGWRPKITSFNDEIGMLVHSNFQFMVGILQDSSIHYFARRYSMMQRCLKIKPNLRPSFESIRLFFEDLVVPSSEC